MHINRKKVARILTLIEQPNSAQIDAEKDLINELRNYVNGTNKV